jgi:hypothetical protein
VTPTPARVGTTREGVVYELFWTCLPSPAFTPADVLDLYLHRGGFETVLSDEDKEQDARPLVLLHRLWSGVLADPFAVDMEPPLFH